MTEEALPLAFDGQSKRNHLEWLSMRQVFAITFVVFSATAIASGQQQVAIRDPNWPLVTERELRGKALEPLYFKN